MKNSHKGNAIVYCEGAFNTPNGKTAHGLVRRTQRYSVLSLVDSHYAGKDGGEVLDGKPKGIPVYENVENAVKAAKFSKKPATHFVIGLAPDGGRLNSMAREAVKTAIRYGLNVDSGLHDFLSEDPEIYQAAAKQGVKIRDVRKPPSRDKLHFFTGRIGEVNSLKVAVLGTDSAVGKRTTAWILAEAIDNAGYKAEMIGTGQTAWMQGARYGIIMDSLVNDFVSGELEHAVLRTWKEARPDIMFIEGQGSLMNPAYPGGFEILAAARPDIIVLQHAPARKEYDGFPGYPIHPLSRQIQVIELLSGKPVIAVTISNEGIAKNKVSSVCEMIHDITGIPTFDVLLNGGSDLAKIIIPFLKNKKWEKKS